MIIYRIVSIINNKVYIGQTTSKLSSRKGLHLFHLRNNKHPNPHLQASFNKYKEANFRFEAVYICSSIEELNIKEKEYIDFYYSLDRAKGYNIRIGGLNELLSNEHKTNIAKALVGNTNGKGNRGLIKPRPFGLNHTIETKSKISNSLKGHKRTQESINKVVLARQRRVEQLTLDNILINEFPSIKEASIATNISRGFINLCCQNKKRSSKFIFKYKESKLIPNENIICS